MPEYEMRELLSDAGPEHDPGLDLVSPILGRARRARRRSVALRLAASTAVGVVAVAGAVTVGHVAGPGAGTGAGTGALRTTAAAASTSPTASTTAPRYATFGKYRVEVPQGPATTIQRALEKSLSGSQVILDEPITSALGHHDEDYWVGRGSALGWLGVQINSWRGSDLPGRMRKSAGGACDPQVAENGYTKCRVYGTPDGVIYAQWAEWNEGNDDSYQVLRLLPGDVAMELTTGSSQPVPKDGRTLSGDSSTWKMDAPGHYPDNVRTAPRSPVTLDQRVAMATSGPLVDAAEAIAKRLPK